MTWLRAVGAFLLSLLSALKTYFPGALQAVSAFIARFFNGNHAFTIPKWVRVVVAVSLITLAAILIGLTAERLALWAGQVVPADDRNWEWVMQARIIAFRARVVFGLGAGVLIAAWLAFQALDRTALGKRLWHWSQALDSEASGAAKTLGASLCFIGLVLAFAFLAARVLP